MVRILVVPCFGKTVSCPTVFCRSVSCPFRVLARHDVSLRHENQKNIFIYRNSFCPKSVKILKVD
uniref:Uncharacterized protein n=1 Tax=Meloidogyne enterolobii TaxID=390850 RepID=A0A6V7VGZ4_MELEN|nr:unnamed protein product [Meloidogyne enterolobii]